MGDLGVLGGLPDLGDQGGLGGLDVLGGLVGLGQPGGHGGLRGLGGLSDLCGLGTSVNRFNGLVCTRLIRNTTICHVLGLHQCYCHCY